jgi:hypothetical protein
MPSRGKGKREKKVDKSTGLGGSAVVLCPSACSASRLLSVRWSLGGLDKVMWQQGRGLSQRSAGVLTDARDAVSPSPRSVRRFGFYGVGTLPRVLCDEEHTC